MDNASTISENVVVTYDQETALNNFIAFDSSSQQKRPVVIIIHEWWGLNDYTRRRARMIAELGYFAFAMDIFGDGRSADNAADAGNLAGPFYKDPAKVKQRFELAIEKIKSFEIADMSNIAIIGYCFGGGMALNIARMGANVKGVVSFHGSLIGVPADKNTLKAQILVCHGGADKFVSNDEVTRFKAELDAAGAHYIFKTYEGATHAFTNPDATANGIKNNMPIAYHAEADAASWEEMKHFFETIFM